MRASLTTCVTWMTAFAIVGSLYAPALLGVRSNITTPLFAALIAAGLIILALGNFPRFPVAKAMWPTRGMSVAILALAIDGFLISAVAGRFDRPYNLDDWGLLGLQAGVPILIALISRRLLLLNALGWICVGFATADFAFNLWLVSQGVWQRAPGLSGNTHAAGLVAFMAIAVLAENRASRWRWPLIVVLFSSLYLIEARRYLGMAAVAVPLLVFRSASKVPLILVMAVTATVGLIGTFAAGMLGLGDDLRASLMVTGLQDALGHPLLGAGPAWRDTSALVAGYQVLARAGVTESGILDLSIAYGIPAAMFFLSAAVLALIAARSRLTLPAVLLALLTAELAFGDSLTGFLGSVLFFTSLTYCQRDELRLLASA